MAHAACAFACLFIDGRAVRMGRVCAGREGRIAAASVSQRAAVFFLLPDPPACGTASHMGKIQVMRRPRISPWKRQLLSNYV